MQLTFEFSDHADSVCVSFGDLVCGVLGVSRRGRALSPFRRVCVACRFRRSSLRSSLRSPLLSSSAKVRFHMKRFLLPFPLTLTARLGTPLRQLRIVEGNDSRHGHQCLSGLLRQAFVFLAAPACLRVGAALVFLPFSFCFHQRQTTCV